MIAGYDVRFVMVSGRCLVATNVYGGTTGSLPTTRLIVTLATVSLNRSEAYSLRVLDATAGKEYADSSLGRI